MDYDTETSPALAKWDYYNNFNGCKITFFMNGLAEKSDKKALECIIHEFVHQLYIMPWEFVATQYSRSSSKLYFNLMEKSVDETTQILLPLFMRYLKE